MDVCDHCAGQRFDRAQVLRVLRQTRKSVRSSRCSADKALALAIEAVKSLDIPHLEVEDEGEVVH